MLQSFVEDRDKWVRSAAIKDIVERVGVEGASLLIGRLTDRVKMIRWEAAEGLGVLRFAPAAPALVETLRDDRTSLVRVCAAEALGELGDTSPPVVAALLEAMQNDRALLVREYAAESLGRLGATETRERIHQRLSEETNTRVRASLLEALARLGDPDALPALLGMLTRVKDEDVLAAIINLIGGIADRDNAPAILSFMEPFLEHNQSFPLQPRTLLGQLRRLASQAGGPDQTDRLRGPR